MGDELSLVWLFLETPKDTSLIHGAPQPGYSPTLCVMGLVSEMGQEEAHVRPRIISDQEIATKTQQHHLRGNEAP